MHDLLIFYRNEIVRHREQILGAIHFGMMKKRHFDRDQKDDLSSVEREMHEPRLRSQSATTGETMRSRSRRTSARPERKLDHVFGPVPPSSAEQQCVRVTYLYPFEA